MEDSNWFKKNKVAYRLLALANLLFSGFLYFLGVLGSSSGMTKYEYYSMMAWPSLSALISVINFFYPIGGVIPYISLHFFFFAKNIIEIMLKL
jgi:hypothetical protein